MRSHGHEGNMAATVGCDFSFFDGPHALNGDLVKIEIEGVKQERLRLGWAR